MLNEAGSEISQDTDILINITTLIKLERRVLLRVREACTGNIAPGQLSRSTLIRLVGLFKLLPKDPPMKGFYLRHLVNILVRTGNKNCLANNFPLLQQF